MRRRGVFAIAVAPLAAGCSGGTAPQESESASAAGSTTKGVPGTRQQTDLRDIGQLCSLFNTRSGEPRLIVLVSPT
jgi:hypothetical protein